MNDSAGLSLFWGASILMKPADVAAGHSGRDAIRISNDGPALLGRIQVKHTRKERT